MTLYHDGAVVFLNTASNISIHELDDNSYILEVLAHCMVAFLT